MFDIKKLYTRELSNKGFSLPLINPVTGEDTGAVIYLRGPDSEEFRRLDAELLREAIEIYNKDKELGKTFQSENEKKLIAGLIIGWTDTNPCTFEQALELVENSPSIADVVSREAGNRRSFFANASKSSLTTSPPTLS
jgi:hypothetical protein